MAKPEAPPGYRRLLIPIGGGDPAPDVLYRAGTLLRRPGVTVTLLGVIPLRGSRSDSPLFRADPGHQPVIDRLDRLRSRLESQGIAAETQVRFGPAAEGIAREAEQAESDLIVMSTRGLTEAGGLVLGSVAQKVMHAIRVPVLVYRRENPTIEAPPARPATAFRRILVLLDRTLFSEQILPAVVRLGRDQGSELCLSTTLHQGASARLHRLARAYLDSQLEILEGSGVAATSEVLWGDPGDTAIASSRRGFDAIAMATHGRTPFGAFFWGSETAHVLTETDIPVLAVRGRRREIHDSRAGNVPEPLMGIRKPEAQRARS